MTRDPKARKKAAAKAKRAMLRLKKARRPLSDDMIEKLRQSAEEKQELVNPPAHFVANDIILSMATEIAKRRAED